MIYSEMSRTPGHFERHGEAGALRRMQEENRGGYGRFEVKVTKKRIKDFAEEALDIDAKNKRKERDADDGDAERLSREAMNGGTAAAASGSRSTAADRKQAKAADAAKRKRDEHEDLGDEERAASRSGYYHAGARRLR